MNLEDINPFAARNKEVTDYLNEKFELIQQDYQEWFDEREIDKDNIGPNLIDHYTLYQSGHTFTLNFVHNSDLPQEIKNRCIDVFKDFFKK
jgi:hypothetical protein